MNWQQYNNNIETNANESLSLKAADENPLTLNRFSCLHLGSIHFRRDKKEVNMLLVRVQLKFKFALS